MNSRAILNICLKVVGVYYVLNALNMLPSSISQAILMRNSWDHAFIDGNFQMMLNLKVVTFVSLLIPLILFIISTIVIFYSEKISTFILESEENLTINSEVDNKILNISIKIFGFFSLISAVPPLTSLISKYLIMGNKIKLYDNTAHIEIASFAFRVVLYICIGCFLIRYSNSIAEKISKHDQSF